MHLHATHTRLHVTHTRLHATHTCPHVPPMRPPHTCQTNTPTPHTPYTLHQWWPLAMTGMVPTYTWPPPISGNLAWCGLFNHTAHDAAFSIIGKPDADFSSHRQSPTYSNLTVPSLCSHFCATKVYSYYLPYNCSTYIPTSVDGRWVSLAAGKHLNNLIAGMLGQRVSVTPF
jgi:hypothetical protein